MTNLASFLDTSAATYPDRVAIVFESVSHTYAQVNETANKVANLLSTRGIGPGDNVAICSPNHPWFSTIYYGILKAGATVVPLNFLLKASEFAYHFSDAGVKAVFVLEGSDSDPISSSAREGYLQAGSDENFFVFEDVNPAQNRSTGEMLRELLRHQSSEFSTQPMGDDDTAVIIYTSGTTGRPKGAELTHRNLISNALVTQTVHGMNAQDPETYLCALPLFHSFAQTGMQNAAFAFGGTIVMTRRFDPQEAMQIMAREGVTVFCGVPTMFWRILNEPHSAADIQTVSAGLRFANSGGAALPVEVHREFKERFGVTISEGYGLSETSPGATIAPPGEEIRVGSIGKPLPGVEMKLITEDWSEVLEPEAVGEIAIRGENVMKGYFGRPDETAKVMRDGWFRTGDLARRDADGFYYIVDRAKDLIIRGGFNVYPREVEEVMMQHPAVSLVAVVGVPHEEFGEEIKAFVIRNPHDQTTESELRQWTKERVAPYKYPRTIEFRDAFPTTPTGKILKRELSA